MKQLGRIVPLTDEELQTLFLKARSGDINARNRIIQNNLRLVIKIAYSYTDDVDLLIELIQEGNIGLIKAVEKFDISRGYRFSTYATWWIKHYILKWLVNRNNDVKVPIRLREKIKKLRQIIETRGFESVDDFLEKERITGRKACELRDSLYVGRCIELDEGLIASQRLEEEVFRHMLHSELKNILEKLTSRDRMIIMYRFGLVDGEIYSLSRIAKKFGLTAEGVRQILIRVIKLIQKETVLFNTFRV